MPNTFRDESRELEARVGELNAFLPTPPAHEVACH